MKLQVTLLRHAEAQPAAVGLDDFDRPLSRRGRDEAAAAARRLALERLKPDLILASPAKRTVGTVSFVSREFELEPGRIKLVQALYQAESAAIWEQVRRLPDEVHHVLICGHNPGISDLASRLGPERRRRRMETAGIVAAFWLDARWRTLHRKDAAHTDVYPHGLLEVS